jgi:hypothetical protein
MKISIVIATNDSETSWNVFRLANHALAKKEAVKVFLLGKGVEAEIISNEKFDVKNKWNLSLPPVAKFLPAAHALKSETQAEQNSVLSLP